LEIVGLEVFEKDFFLLLFFKREKIRESQAIIVIVA